LAEFASAKIEVYLGPTELNGPDDLETVILNFIGSAKDSLDIAVQEIDSTKIAEAILDARWRGVQIEMFVEQDYLRSKLKAKPDPPTPEPGETPDDALRRVQWRKDELDLGRDKSLARNRWILAALLRNGIEVRGDYNPEIFTRSSSSTTTARAPGRRRRCSQARPTSPTPTCTET
jgi:hypothetical protein